MGFVDKVKEMFGGTTDQTQAMGGEATDSVADGAETTKVEGETIADDVDNATADDSMTRPFGNS